jgi:hypothetical protein
MYEGSVVLKAPEFASELTRDVWVKADLVCVDSESIGTFAVYKTEENVTDGISTKGPVRVATVNLELRRVILAGSYQFVGIVGFDGHSVGIWFDVTQGTPRPGYSELLGLTKTTFYNDRDL